MLQINGLILPLLKIVNYGGHRRMMEVPMGTDRNVTVIFCLPFPFFPSFISSAVSQLVLVTNLGRTFLVSVITWLIQVVSW